MTSIISAAGQPDEEEVGGRGKIQRRWLGEDIGGRHVQVRGIGSHCQVDDHLVPYRHRSLVGGCSLSHGGDDACGLVANRLRRVTPVAGSEGVQVGRVHAGGAHLYLHLTRSGWL
jgi:hypothetical protein